MLDHVTFFFLTSGQAFTLDDDSEHEQPGLAVAGRRRTAPPTQHALSVLSLIESSIQAGSHLDYDFIYEHPFSSHSPRPTFLKVGPYPAIMFLSADIQNAVNEQSG